MRNERGVSIPSAHDASHLPRPRALLVDLDDTLLDHSATYDSVRRACELLASSFPDLDAEELLRSNDEAWAEYWPEIEDLNWTGKLDGYAVSYEAWRRTLEACGCVDSAIARFAFERHREFEREALRPYPDVADLLTFAAGSDIRLALVTNGSTDFQRDKLRTLGLAHAFEVVVISAEIGVAKPATAPFERAIDELRIDRHDAWHIGDSLANDVGGAIAAGVTAVWLNRRGAARGDDDPVPDLEVSSLLDLIAHLDGTAN